jgi:hypothetical protein
MRPSHMKTISTVGTSSEHKSIFVIFKAETSIFGTIWDFRLSIELVIGDDNVLFIIIITVSLVSIIH